MEPAGSSVVRCSHGGLVVTLLRAAGFLDRLLQPSRGSTNLLLDLQTRRCACVGGRFAEREIRTQKRPRLRYAWGDREGPNGELPPLTHDHPKSGRTHEGSVLMKLANSAALCNTVDSLGADPYGCGLTESFPDTPAANCRLRRFESNGILCCGIILGAAHSLEFLGRDIVAPEKTDRRRTGCSCCNALYSLHPHDSRVRDMKSLIHEMKTITSVYLLTWFSTLIMTSQLAL